MRQVPQGGQYGQQTRRRGIGLSPRLLIVLLFAGYGLYYWMSNRSTDPLTGQTVMIDKNLSAQEENAMGLQAFEEILNQEHPVDPNSQIARQIREIAQRLIAKVPEVTAQLAAERGMQPTGVERSFDWQVAVLQSEQANAFCLPGGKMAVYTGLVPVAQNADAMAIVMGHEISHALLRHGAQRMARNRLEQLGQIAGAMSGMDQTTMQTVMSIYGYGNALPYARGHETQADEVGLMLAAAACYNPQEAVPLWQRMEQMSAGNSPPEFASTHPSAAARLEHLQALMPKAMEYRAKFCGGAGAAGGQR